MKSNKKEKSPQKIAPLKLPKINRKITNFQSHNKIFSNKNRRFYYGKS